MQTATARKEIWSSDFFFIFLSVYKWLLHDVLIMSQIKFYTKVESFILIKHEEHHALSIIFRSTKNTSLLLRKYFFY